jgi:D-alanyl-D-alanine carboxypeptidase
MTLIGCTPLQQFQVPARQTEPKDRLSRMHSRCQEILDEAVNQHKLIGVQLSLKFPDGHIWNGASGTVDRDRHTLMAPSHVIRIGSLTKTYTAVVVFRLIERGILALDSTIDRWLPEYRHSGRITLKMLLNHSSGIPDLLGMRVMFVASMNSTKKWTESELLEMIFDENLAFDPGTNNEYSNSNYVLLGVIAERASGKSLQSLYHDEILSPLSLSHTYLLPSDSIPPELVTGYDRDLIPLPGWHSTEPENTSWSSCAHAAGGMAASAPNVLMFFDAVMNRRIITEQSYAMMTKFTGAKEPKDKYLEKFGLGLFHYGDFYDGAYGHLGLFVGSEAIAIFSPEKRFVLVFLANVSRVNDSDAFIRKYLDLVVGPTAHD